MKTTLVFIAVVILAALAFIMFREKKPAAIAPTPVVVVTQQQPVTLIDGRQCYTYSHEATATEPYTTSEFIDMTIAGTKVTGTKKGTQSGPDMTNGYTGTITGTLANNAISDVFSYVIEGSSNKEREIYRAGLTGLEKLRYPLKEGVGMLVPDMTQDFTILTYARVGCESSN